MISWSAIVHFFKLYTFVVLSSILLLDYCLPAKQYEQTILGLECYRQASFRRSGTTNCGIYTEHFSLPCSMDIVRYFLDESPKQDSLIVFRSSLLRVPYEIVYHQQELRLEYSPYRFYGWFPILFFVFSWLSVLLYKLDWNENLFIALYIASFIASIFAIWQLITCHTP